MDGWMDALMVGDMDGWMETWIDGWMDGCMEKGGLVEEQSRAV